MATKIHLHHLGEEVLAALLGELGRRGELDAPCMLHENCGLAAVLGQAKIGLPVSFDANVQLEPIRINSEKLLFDGAHGIDVLCRGTGTFGLAFEAKLGLERMACGEFKKRFLVPVSRTTHTPGRVKGSMVAILNYRALHAGGLLPLCTAPTATAPSVELVSEWFLVIRREVWKQWANGTARVNLLAAHAHLAIFEDIVERHGDRSSFNQIVLGLVGSDFYGSWGIG